MIVCKKFFLTNFTEQMKNQVQSGKATPIREIDFLAHFPKGVFNKPRPAQVKALKALNGTTGIRVAQMGTGSGKTAVGYTFLKALSDNGWEGLVYVEPRKLLVEQIAQQHPDVKVVFGRNEYPCLFYKDKEFKADEIPCSMLVTCPHRVDQETGETYMPGARPCAYLKAKYEAKHAKISACTTAFFLFTELYNQTWKDVSAVVIGEGHELGPVVRGCLSHEITDYHLEQIIELLGSIGAKDDAKIFEEFYIRMIEIVKSWPAREKHVLSNEEIRSLIKILQKTKSSRIESQVLQAVKAGKLDLDTSREALKGIEDVARNITTYLRLFEYSLPKDDREPLNYTYGYYQKETKPNTKVKYRLYIKSYYVQPAIRKILPEETLVMSATIGDPQAYKMDTGIQGHFIDVGSDFPVANARIYMPKDMPNLSFKSQRKDDLKKILRRTSKAMKKLLEHDIRSLFITVSNLEREKAVAYAIEAGLDVVTYDENLTPREALQIFKEGKGDVLIGTSANYGQGVDMPGGIAQAIFVLRPSYPQPNDPQAIFEKRRFGKGVWKLRNWRVMIEALQARGRNLRSEDDYGVTFFVSKQFERFLYGSLPMWLRPAYEQKLTLDQSVEDAARVLTGETVDEAK